MTSRDVARRNPYLLLHHHKVVTEKFMDTLIRSAAPVAYMSTQPTASAENPPGSPEWEAQAQRLLRGAVRDGLCAVTWAYPLERVRFGHRSVLHSQVHTLTKFIEFEVRMHQMVKLDQLLADREHWVMSMGSRSDLLWTDTFDMNWFLDKCRPFLPHFEPDFGFADLDFNVVNNLADGTDPRTLAWPLMIYGPTEVERLGRDHLQRAPVWNAEELPYGGVWLQVSENPFAYEKPALEALAEHLDLRPAKFFEVHWTPPR